MFLFCLSAWKNRSLRLFSTFRAFQLYSITLSCVLVLEMRHKMSGLNQWKQPRQDYLRMDLCNKMERENKGMEWQLMSDFVSSNRTSPESKLEHTREREEGKNWENPGKSCLETSPCSLIISFPISGCVLAFTLFHSSVWILNNITHHTVVTLTSSYINTFTHSHRNHQHVKLRRKWRDNFAVLAGIEFMREREKTNRKFVTTSNIWKVKWKKSCSCFLSSIKY